MKAVYLFIALAVLAVQINALQLDVANAKCTNIGGTCLNSNTNSCSSGFLTGYCSGAAHIRCCPPSTAASTPVAATPNSATTTSTADPNGSSKCALQGGTCINTNSLACSTSLLSGLCPGASNIRCCVGTTSTPSPGLTTSTRSTKMAPWSVLASCFPQGSPEDVKVLLGGAVNADWITNTCAIRMSAVLNCAARKTGKSHHKVAAAGSLTISSANKDRHYFRVRELDPIIRQKYGKPSLTVSSPRGTRGVDPTAFHGKKGIIYFNTQGAWDDATGHLDLWDGRYMIDLSKANPDTTHRYFSLSIAVHLWETA